MKFSKEIISAGIVGFLLGILIAWGILNFPPIPSKKEAPFISPLLETKQATPYPEEFTLNIIEPLNEIISEQPQVKIKGSTNKGNVVVISGPLEDKIIEITNDGIFSTSIELEEGINEIIISAYSEDGIKERTETRIINYIKEEF